MNILKIKYMRQRSEEIVTELMRQVWFVGIYYPENKKRKVPNPVTELEQYLEIIKH